MAATGLIAIPIGLLVLSWSWTRATERPLPTPAQLAQRMDDDKASCDATARVESPSGLRRDAGRWSACMVERGWTLAADGTPLACVGSCLDREARDP